MKVLDLFSGIGGFTLGLHKVGFKTVAFCEIDKYCRKVLQKHYKDIKIYDDVKKLKGEEIKQEVGAIDIIVGGFPCQPFSVAGAKKGTSDDRHLWPEMFRLIKELKPRWVIGENVRGIISIQDGMVFENVCTDLEGEGYEVRAFNIPAAGVGAPHRRERIWIVANSRRSIRREQSSRNTESIRSRTSQETKRSSNTSKISGSSEGAKVMANTNTRLSDGTHEEVQSRGQTFDASSQRTDVANADGERQQKQWGSESIQEKVSRQTTGTRSECESGWSVEPDVGRVAHGVSGRVHRLKALGNSIVPKIAEEIGRAIMIAETDEQKYQSGGAYKAILNMFAGQLEDEKFAEHCRKFFKGDII